MMSDSDTIELQSSQRLPPNTEKDSVWEPLVESESGHDISGRSSVRPLEPSYLELPEKKGHSGKKGYRRILSLICHLVLVHVPPVVITLVVLSLYINKVRWGNPTNNALNALQFAAKIHEGLIIVSVGDILMGRINHHLLNKGDSLPLGFLPSPLLLNSPFSYLISPELWAPILSLRGRHGTRKVTGAMILLSALLCIAASPLSAIAMLPRQGWRLAENGIQSSSRLAYTPGTLYNNDLDAGAIPDTNYTRPSPWSSRPSQRSMLETTIAPGYSGSGFYTNVTYSHYEATARPMSIQYSFRGMSATCPVSTVARHLGESSVYDNPFVHRLTRAKNKQDGSSTLTNWKQPLVVAQCISGRLEDDIASFEFSADPGIGPGEIFDTLEIRSAEHPWLREISNNTIHSAGPRGYTFLNIKDSKKLQISTDMMFATIVNETRNRTTGDIIAIRPATIHLTLCVISARWAEADVWVEPDRSSNALSHFNFVRKPIEDDAMKIRQSFGTPEFINIHQDWMTGIGSVPTNSANRSSYEEAHIFCMESTRTSSLDYQCLQAFLAMHVADAIAELGEFQEDARDSSGKSIQPEVSSVIYTSYEYLYSYEFKNSIGIPIAFSVLLIHVLIVLFYIPLVFWSEHLRHKSGWSSLGDLLVLTLRSDVDVDWTKGKASQKWTRPVVVRELGDEGRKGMIVRDIGNNVD